MRKIFAEEILRMVNMYASGRSTIQIAASLDISQKTVAVYLDRAGIQRKRRTPGRIPYAMFEANQKVTPLMERQIVKLYSENSSSTNIAKNFNLSHNTVLRYLSKNNYPIRTTKITSRKFTINNQFFTSINTELKAYWLGFLAADGYVNIKRHVLALALARKDRGHLEKFNLSTQSNYPINDYDYRSISFSRIFITDERIASDLVKFFPYNKTYSLRFPSLTPTLIRHFIRGYFDGDGSICALRYGGEFSITSNVHFLSELQLQMSGALGLNLTKLNTRHKNNPLIKTVRWGGIKNLKTIYEYLYRDASIFLDRKRKTFVKILNPGAREELRSTGLWPYTQETVSDHYLVWAKMRTEKR